MLKMIDLGKIMIKIVIASTYSMQASTDRYSALVHTVAPLTP